MAWNVAYFKDFMLAISIFRAQALSSASRLSTAFSSGSLSLAIQLIPSAKVIRRTVLK